MPNDAAQSSSSPSLPTVAPSISYSSSMLTSSTSSGSTIPGLGELSGKAILALGKVTIRTAEYLIIRRRLNVISSKFPHTNVENIFGIVQMYEDLLELSRLGVYTESIRNRVIRMLLIQIGSRQTRHLQDTLSHWSPIDIELFVSELLFIFDPIRLLSLEIGSDLVETMQAYRKSLASSELDSLVPLIDFLKDMARSPSLALAILQGGMMDFLFNLYATGFRDLSRSSYHIRGKFLQNACNSFLSAVLSGENELQSISDHPLFVVWTAGNNLPFIDGVLNRETWRIQVWNMTKKPIIFWRLTSAFNSLLSMPATDTPCAYDIYVDLLELSASDIVDPDISYRALRTYLRFNARRYVISKIYLRRYLASNSTRYSTEFMMRFIICLSRVVSKESPECKLFFMSWDNAHTKLSAVLHFIRYFVDAAKTDENFLSIAIDANILGLLRPFLEIELRGHANIIHHEGDLILKYDPPDLNLLVLIKERGLQDLLPKRSDMTFIGSYRRDVLCQAFDVFMRRGDLQKHPDIPCPDSNDLFWSPRYLAGDYSSPEGRTLLQALPSSTKH